MTGADGKAALRSDRLPAAMTRTRSRPARSCSTSRPTTSSALPAASTPTGARWPGFQRRDRGRRPREQRRVPRVPAERVPELGRHGARRQRVRQQAQRPQLLGEVQQHGNVEPRPWANFKTSVGARLHQHRGRQLSAQGRGLAPGASSLGATATAVSWSATTFSAVKTLGYYAQEQLTLRDRLFLTAAVRQDQNSAFGTKFQNVKYPEVERVVAALRRVVLPARALAQLLPPPQRVSAPAACSQGRRRRCRRSHRSPRDHDQGREHRNAHARPVGVESGQPVPQAGNVAGARDGIRDGPPQSPVAHRFHALQQDDARCADQRADSVVGRRVDRRACCRTSARRTTGATSSR